MTRNELARSIATSEGQDFDGLPRDMNDWREGTYPGRDSGEPFQRDYLAAAEAQLAERRSP